MLKSAVPEYTVNFSLRVLAMCFSFFASIYGGFPITISKPSFEGRLRHTQKSMIDAIFFPSFLQAIYWCMKLGVDKISVEGGF